MTEERLLKRFEPTKVHCLMSLWSRVRDGLDAMLQESNHTVRWRCETVTVSFDAAANARVAELLSDGAVDPTEGNDFLFLFINEMSK